MATDPWSPPDDADKAQHQGVDHGSFYAGSPIPNARWGIPDAVLTLALAPIIALLTALIVRPYAPLSPWHIVGITMVPWVGLLGWPLWVAQRKGNGWRADYAVTLTPRSMWIGLSGGIIAILSAGIVAITQMSITGNTFTSTAADVAKKLATEPGALIAFALVAAVGAPIVEEIAFRGLLYGALLKRGIPEWAVVVITAAAFALYHFEPARIALLFATGVVLGEVRRRSGGTAAPILTHAINNAVAALGLLSFL